MSGCRLFLHFYISTFYIKRFSFRFVLVKHKGHELAFVVLPGQDSGFLHTHKTHEELYIILVECDGSITYIEVSNVTEEDKTKIVRLLETMPRWVPGKKDGQPIRSRYRTTIRF